MGEEVRATSRGMMPPEAGEEPGSQDSAGAFVRNTAVMSVGTALSRLTGFLRLTFAAAALGDAVVASSYNAANVTPNIVYELILGGVLTSVFVPVFVEWLEKRGRDEAWDLARRVLTLALVVLVLIAAAAIVFAPWIMRLYYIRAPASSRAESIALGTFFLRWFMPQIVFYGVGAVATGLLNAHRRFAVPMFAPILNNLTVIATFAAFMWIHHGAVTPETVTTGQKLLLALGTTLGVAAMTVALWPSLRAIGFRWRPTFRWRDDGVRRLTRLAGWVAVYVVANQVAYVVVLILAGQQRSWYTVYSYAFILFQLPYAIFAVSIFTALIPSMSSRWADHDTDGLRTLLSQGLRMTALIVLPAAAGYLAIAVPITRLILGHGHFHAVALTARTLEAFSLGLLFFAAFQLLTRTFYSMQDSRTPALVNVAAAGVNIGLDVLYVNGLGLGVQGLALGHASTYAFSTLVSIVLLRRRLGRLDGRRIAASVLRISVAAAAAAVAAWLIARLAGSFVDVTDLDGQVVQVGTAVVAGVLAFLAAALMLRIEEVDVLRKQLTARWRR
ncbi:MAG: murein biosynthesis integral membrane protein MurJ [Actinomycetota bacterium]